MMILSLFVAIQATGLGLGFHYKIFGVNILILIILLTLLTHPLYNRESNINISGIMVKKSVAKEVTPAAAPPLDNEDSNAPLRSLAAALPAPVAPTAAYNYRSII